MKSEIARQLSIHTTLHPLHGLHLQAARKDRETAVAALHGQLSE